ncbi:MAG TPA: oligosaccharide flippase family protein [Phycisphaerae bacterium]|nr:oligosaccharide flippase family protein [Phycisphaerae bacterium]
MSPRFGRHVAATFVAYMAGLAANLLVSILVSRLLGPEKAGHLVMAMVGPNVLALVGTLGLPAAVSHFLSRRPDDARRIAASALAWSLACGAALAGAYLAALPWVAPAAGVALPLAALAAAVIPLEILIQTTMAVCQGRQAFGRRMAILLSYRWLYAALAAGAVALGHRDPTAIVAASVAAYLLADVAALVTAVRLARGAAREGEDAGDGGREVPSERGGLLRAMAAYGWRAHVSAVLMLLLLRADVYLVRWFTGDAAEVGFYSRGAQVAEVVLYFLLAVENVLFPRMSGLPPSEIPAAAAALCRRGLLAGLALAVAFEAASHWLIVVPFGEAFAPSIAPLRILLPGVLAVGFARMLFAVFYAQERPWAPAVVTAVALALVTGLDLTLIPRWGIQGAAAASLAGYALAAVASLAWFARRNGMRARDFLIPRREDLAALRARG